MWKKRHPTFNHLVCSTFPRGHKGQHHPPRSAATSSASSFFPFIPWIARPRAHSPFIMDVVAAVSGYISKMVTAGESASASSSTKMKILLLDSETVRLTLTKHIAGHDRLITFYPGIHCLNCHHPVRPPEPRSLPH